MNRTTDVALGFPIRRLSLRIVVPFGLLLLGAVAVACLLALNRVQHQALTEEHITIRTLFETQVSVQDQRNGLAILSLNRGYERVWVLNATGYILASSRKSEVGQRLESRWWRLLEDRGSGLVQERIHFGEKTLDLTALHHAEMGRWVVVLSRPVSYWTLASLYLGLILVVGLIIWITLTGILYSALSQKISRPLKKLDDRITEVARGGSLSEAALERLWAETAPALGGHADRVVDLLRHAATARDNFSESEVRFRLLFDSIPSMAFIRSRDGQIVMANKTLMLRLGAQNRRISGQSVHVLKEVLPVQLLEQWFSKEKSSKVGVERMELYRADSEEIERPIVLSILPVRVQKKAGHLVLIDEMFDVASSGDGASAATDFSVSETSGQLLEGLMQATGQFVVVFNEKAETIFWSPAAKSATGVSRSEIPDMKAFAERIFPTPKERKLFKSWIDGDPDQQSQKLKISTPRGVSTSKWSACEIVLDGHGSLGVLWASLNEPLRRKSPVNREPAAS